MLSSSSKARSSFLYSSSFCFALLHSSDDIWQTMQLAWASLWIRNRILSKEWTQVRLEQDPIGLWFFCKRLHTRVGLLESEVQCARFWLKERLPELNSLTLKKQVRIGWFLQFLLGVLQGKSFEGQVWLVSDVLLSLLGREELDSVLAFAQGKYHQLAELSVQYCHFQHLVEWMKLG